MSEMKNLIRQSRYRCSARSVCPVLPEEKKEKKPRSAIERFFWQNAK
nr:hypothetical protein [Candidatus Hamiltonella defensa]